MNAMPLHRLNFLNLTEKDWDRHIYRIMCEEYVLHLFSTGENVLVQTHKWKDKFENFLLNAGGVLNGETFAYEFKDDFVGQCWTSHSLSEAMWGIYASDPKKRFLRIRSTPRKLLTSLVAAHPLMPQDTCFVGKVAYETEARLIAFLRNDGQLQISPRRFAQSLLLKRRSFKHEAEIRLLYFDNSKRYADGLYRYKVDPHTLVTQIMADPNRDRTRWLKEREEIKKATGFAGQIKRSKTYDPPEWNLPVYHSTS